LLKPAKSKAVACLANNLPINLEDKLMFHSSALDLKRDFQSQTLSLKLILKVPKSYRLSEFLLALIMLTGVQLSPVGKLSGTQSDNFNWCYVEMTGMISELIEIGLYLQALPVKIKVTEIKFDSAIFSSNN
jgi:hypothetical protein